MTEHPFDRALRQAALRAIQQYVGEQSRIGKGLTIALNGGVQLAGLPEGLTAWVRSDSDPEVTYEVNGTHCDCPDQAAPGGRCKHRWSVYLARIGQATLDLADHQE